MYRRSPPGRDAIVNRCAPKRGSHSLRRPADSLPQSRSKSRHTVTQRRFGDINCSDFVCAKPGKTWIEQNTLRARVWQCKCLSPSRYEKQTHTSRPQPFIHSHSNLPLQQCNNFVSTLPQVLGAGEAREVPWRRKASPSTSSTSRICRPIPAADCNSPMPDGNEFEER